MEQDWLVALSQKLTGRRCSIQRREGDWAASIHGGGVISLGVPWRIISEGRIAFADQDDGQKFGLPAPLDGEAEANRLLSGKTIEKVTVDPETADLGLHFESGVRLEAFNYSAGYEGWQIILPPAEGGMWVIALGGGDVSIFFQ